MVYQYSNANTQQLWDALGGDIIINMMNEWVLKSGFPYLNISIIENNNENIIFNITQKRMFMQGPMFFENYDSNNNKYSLKYDMDLIKVVVNFI